MADLKSVLRTLLKGFTSGVKVRGRHRLVNIMGYSLAPDPPLEVMSIDGFNVEIDHSIEFNRYIYYHLYEEYFLDLLKKTLRNGDVFFDPGANLGYITSVASSLVGATGKVFAFEPSKCAYQKIVQSNPQIKKNIHLYHAAISDKTGKAAFNDTPRAISKGYACLDSVDHPDDSIPYEIDTFSLDDFCLKNNVAHIRFLKLDIEGAELLALQGADSLLKNGRIDYILVETEVKDSTRERQKELLYYMESFNYKPHRLLRGGNLQTYTPDLTGNHTEDIIWVHRKLNSFFSGR